jgi:hypothetical protein
MLKNTTSSSSPRDLKVENTMLSSSPPHPLKLWGSSSHNIVKHSMDTHTHTHTRLDLRECRSNSVFSRTHNWVPKWKCTTIHYHGGSSLYLPWIQTLFSCTFSQETTEILLIIYQIYRSFKVSFHIDKMNYFILFYFIFPNKLIFFLKFEIIFIYIYIAPIFYYNIVICPSNEISEGVYSLWK